MKSEKRVIAIVFGTLILDMVGTGMVIPIIPTVFTDASSPFFIFHGYSTQVQYFVTGLVIGLFGLMQFIAAPLLGQLSDTYGRKKLLAIGVFALAIGQLLFGFGVFVSSIALIIVSRIISGIAGANFSIAQAAVADVTSKADRTKNFALISSAFGIGFVLGPPLGGWLATWLGNPAAPFWFAGALGLVNVISVLFLLPETLHEKARQKQYMLFHGVRNLLGAFRATKVRTVYLSNLLLMSGFWFFLSSIGILFVQNFAVKTSSIGAFFGVVGVCFIITQIVILRFLIHRFTERQILKFSLLGVATGLFFCPFVPSLQFMYVVIPLLAVPLGLSLATINALVSKSVNSDEQGSALGINSSLIAFAQGVMPILAGLAAGFMGIEAPFIIGSLMVLCAWLLFFMPSWNKVALEPVNEV